MIPFSKKTACLFCTGLTILCLGGCGKKPAPTDPADEIITLPTAPVQETVDATTSPMELVEDLTVQLEAGEIYTLDYYPNLKSVDLSGSTCYDTILDYIAKHPRVDVTYTVSFGAESISNKASSGTLNHQGLDYSLLLENLAFLPDLKSLSLPEMQLDSAQVEAVTQKYPGLSLDYTVELLGQELSSGITELDLKHMEPSQVEEARSRLGLLTNLTDVYLNNALSLEQVALLQDSNPGATFHYSFSLFGKTLSTTDEQVEFVNLSIGNEGEAQLRQALAVLDNCQRFLLDNCKIDNEILARLREDFRDQTSVVWRVYFGTNNRYNTLTDAEMIRAVYHVTDETVAPLKYCEGAKYIDMGHNDYLTDLSFLSHMPNLEAFIGSGCAVKEMPDMSNSKNLLWLELANCLKLENIDTLADAENLRYLNLSNTKVKSYQALDSLPLELFKCVSPKAPKEERAAFTAIHEGCGINWTGNVYGRGWRYKDNGKAETSLNYTEYYETVIRQVFNLDYLESLLPKETKK